MEVNSDKLLAWLDYCRKKKCIPDFVSIIAFPYHPVNEGKKAFAKRVTNENEIINQVKMARVSLDVNGFDKCKLYITECNNSLSSRNYLNDSCFRATYMARLINELGDIPDLIGLWMGSDLVSSYYDTSRIVNGGNGLITKDKIKKPVYYALSFLNRLGSKLIKRGENYLITSNDMNSYYIFCFNYKKYSYDYYLQDENKLDLSELSNLFENDDSLNMKINLNEMPEGKKIIIKKHTVNNEHGSILNQWSKFKYEKDIENSDLKYLRNICIPDITMEKQVVQNGSLEINLQLKSHEISLIHIYEEN